MMITAITGKVGAGKSLLMAIRIHEYLRRGRRVVANFEYDDAPVQPLLKKLLGRPVPKIEVCNYRPSVEEIIALGRGGKNEHEAGLLVLDETGGLFNAREWQNKDRSQFIDWLLHTRKLGWDVDLGVQNIGLLDKQIRVAVVESLITCKRMDRLRVPLLGIKLPRMHMAVERYGCEINAPIAARTYYRGNRFFPCYDTQAIFQNEEQASQPQEIQLTQLQSAMKDIGILLNHRLPIKYWPVYKRSEPTGA